MQGGSTFGNIIEGEKRALGPAGCGGTGGGHMVQFNPIFPGSLVCSARDCMSPPGAGSACGIGENTPSGLQTAGAMF